MYKVIDLFAGAGGLSLGFEQVGFVIKKAVENNKMPNSVTAMTDNAIKM